MARTRLTDALVQLTHLVQNVFSDVSRDHGLTPQQVQLLCHLKDGPVGMGELGRALHLEKSSLTGLVDRVERRGLVDRVRETHDRRSCRIELTRAGARLAVDCHHDVTTRLARLTNRLDRADRAQLGATVTELLDVSRSS